MRSAIAIRIQMQRSEVCCAEHETVAHVELSVQQMLMHDDREDIRTVEPLALETLEDIADGLLFAFLLRGDRVA